MLFNPVFLNLLDHRIFFLISWKSVLWNAIQDSTKAYIGCFTVYHWLPQRLSSKESAYNAGDVGSILGLGRYPGGSPWQPTPVFWPGESPWTEVPGRPQSIRVQRVRQDWVIKHRRAVQWHGLLTKCGKETSRGEGSDLQMDRLPLPHNMNICFCFQILFNVVDKDFWNQKELRT